MPSLSAPALVALALQLILIPLTWSYSLPPTRGRRLWTPLLAAGGAHEGSDDGGRGSRDASPLEVEAGADAHDADAPRKDGAFGSLERIVRRVTGNEEYKFGDVTRTVVNSTTSGFEGAVRAMTKDEDYQFGDLTKRAIGSTTSGFEEVVKSVTRNEEYKFGDLTRGTVSAAGSVLTYSEKALGLIRENNIHELVELMNLYWMGAMNDSERREAFAVVAYLGAILVLSYNFVANLMSGMVFAAAWARTSVATGASPLSPGAWPRLLETKSTLEIFFGGPCLPVRAIVTLPWFFRYRRFVVGLAHKSPLRENFPIINRCISLGLSWVVANLAFVGGITFLMVKFASVITGVPLAP